MAKKPRVDESRVPGGYCALPWDVIDSPAYQSLSYPAVALLIELARQYVRNNNGRLLLSMRYLGTRGWRSGALIDRAKRELLDAKLIYQTVQGHRPNKASWFALTWYSLDKIPGFDAGAVEGFRRGMYTSFQPPAPTPTRQALFEKWRGHGKTAVPKIDMLSPAGGLERVVIAPAAGLETKPPSPAGGAIKGVFDTSPSPAGGNHLDKPFCTGESLSAGFGSLAVKKGGRTKITTSEIQRPAAATATTTTTATTDGDPADDSGQFERVRDGDLDPSLFNPDTG